MKKSVPIALAAGVLALAVWLSILMVPAGHFAIAGAKELGPGRHIKPFWSRARIYADSVTLVETLHLRTREGATKDVKATATFTWDRERLKRNPSDEAAVLRAMAGVDRYNAVTLRADLKQALAAFPLLNLDITSDVEGELPAELKSAYVPTGRPIVFLGLDAMDWILIDRLIAEGKMPTFARLKREGAWARLQSFKPMLSPLLWTSIATSRPPEEHGILDFVIKDPATGQKALITSHYRKVQAFWNILSAYKLKTDVVGWWATFPADKINGTMISERLFFSLFGIEPLNLVPGNTYPPGAEARFSPLMVRAEQVPFEEVGRFVNLPRAQLEQRWEEGMRSGNLHEDRVNHLRKIIASTRSVLNITRSLMKEPFDMLACYVEGTDTVAHRFADCLPPRLPRVSEEDFRIGRDTLPRYYEWMDEELEAMMRQGPRDAVWIIASDHGFFTGGARPTSRPDDFLTGAPEWHRSVGVLVIAGPGVKPGELKDATIYDLIPTLFHILGVPASREMKGRAVAEAFTGIAAVPRTDTYEFLPPPQRDQTSVPLNEERMKELKALGYIAGAAQTTAAASAPGAESRETFSQVYNLATSLYQQGNFKAAMEHYRRSVELRPDFSIGMFSLAQCYALQGDHRRAVDWIKRAVQIPQGLPGKILIQLVDESKAIGEVDAALEVLAAVRPDWEKDPSYFVALGRAHAARGDEAEAVRWFEHARALDPGNPLATEELLNRYVAKRDMEGLARLIKSAWDASAGSIQTLTYLGLVSLRAGQGRIAEEIFRKVLESDPQNGDLLVNLAMALQIQGRSREAREALEAVLALEPANPEARRMLDALDRR